MTVHDPTLDFQKVAKPGISVPMASFLGFIGLAVVSWASILWGGKSGFSELFMAGTWAGVAEFIGQLLGRGTERTPTFLDFASWRDALWLSLDTIAMSVLAIGFAALAVLLTFLPAARNVAFGELSGNRSAIGCAGFFLMRGVFVFTRGVPELLWAMLIVFVFSQGILAGAIALGLQTMAYWASCLPRSSKTSIRDQRVRSGPLGLATCRCYCTAFFPSYCHNF